MYVLVACLMVCVNARICARANGLMFLVLRRVVFVCVVVFFFFNHSWWTWCCSRLGMVGSTMCLPLLRICSLCTISSVMSRMS